MEEAKIKPEKEEDKTKKTKTLIHLFRRRILILALIAFAVTVGFFIFAQEITAKRDAIEILNLNMADVQDRIEKYADTKLLAVAENVKFYIDYKEKNFGKEFRVNLCKQFAASNDDIAYLKFLAYKFGVTDIVIVGDDGLISCASEENQIGFDMASGEQSGEFLRLLGEETQLAQVYQPMSKDSSQWRKYAGMKLAEEGFVQVAYGEDKFHSVLDPMVQSLTANRRIGESGYMAVFDENGFAVSLRDRDTSGMTIASFGSSVENLELFADGEPREVSIGGEQCDCVAKKIEGYYVIAVLPKSEAQANRRTNTFAAATLVALTVVAVLFVIYALIKGTILKNLKQITEGLNDIAHGNLDVKLNVKGNEEFESLSKNINATVESLKNYRDTEAKRIEEELEYAKNIQRSSLPSVFPPYPEHGEFEIFATMNPAKEVGGDFFDFSLIKNHYLGFCVADVSGKGVPAALFMMRAKTLIQSLGQAGKNANEILYAVNNELCINNDEGMFVTCWVGIMDIDTGVVEYANAGHNLPIICKSDGSCAFVQNKPNFVLGGMEDVDYKLYSMKLEPNERLFIYTDGVTEATNAEKELFGEKRLINTLETLRNESCKNICLKVRKHIDEFAGEEPQFDDITMLSLLYKGSDNILTVEANLKNYDKIMDFIDQRIEELGFSPKEILKINLACDEVIANITSYAYGDGTGDMSVRVDALPDKSGAEIVFSDHGVPFNPLDREDPDVNKSVEERKVGGLGIFMVKKTMDNVEYEYVDNTNILKLIKYFSR